MPSEYLTTTIQLDSTHTSNNDIPFRHNDPLHEAHGPVTALATPLSAAPSSSQMIDQADRLLQTISQPEINAQQRGG